MNISRSIFFTGKSFWCLYVNFLRSLILILLAFITGDNSLEPLLEGLFAQIHIDLSWRIFGRNRTWDLRITQIFLSPALFSTELWWRMHHRRSFNIVIHMFDWSRTREFGLLCVKRQYVLFSNWSRAQVKDLKKLNRTDEFWRKKIVSEVGWRPCRRVDQTRSYFVRGVRIMQPISAYADSRMALN